MAKKDFRKTAAELFITPQEEKPEPPAQPDKAAGFEVPKGYRLEREYKTARMQLLIRPTTKEYIKKTAAAQGISMNDLINQILDEYAEEGQG